MTVVCIAGAVVVVVVGCVGAGVVGPSRIPTLSWTLTGLPKSKNAITLAHPDELRQAFQGNTCQKQNEWKT